MRNVICPVVSFLVIVLLFVTFSGYAQTPEKIFEAGNKFYMTQSYDKAIESYEKLVSMNKVSAEVYFNLGNSYYKTGNYASAILNYERAKKIRPSDEDNEYNLRMANLNTIDKIEPIPEVIYEKWWNNFVNNGSVSQRATTGIIMLWITFILAIAYFFFRQVTMKKISFFAMMIMLVISVFTLYLTWLQHDHLNDHKAAVIFSPSAFVKSSPNDKSPNLFLLHSGTRIEVLDELKGWKKIKIANGNIGWVTEESLEII